MELSAHAFSPMIDPKASTLHELTRTEREHGDASDAAHSRRRPPFEMDT
jgi:hypothetical protein